LIHQQDKMRKYSFVRANQHYALFKTWLILVIKTLGPSRSKTTSSSLDLWEN
jgi:hypothetical protein